MGLAIDHPCITDDYQLLLEFLESQSPYAGLTFDFEEELSLYAYPIYSPFSESGLDTGEVPAGILVYQLEVHYNTIFITPIRVYPGVDWPAVRDEAFRGRASAGGEAPHR